MPPTVPPEDLLPVRHAEALTRCLLLWLPATTFPLPQRDKRWMLTFLARLQAALLPKAKPQFFLQQKEVYEKLQNQFLDTSMESIPWMGMSRIPGAPLKPPMTMTDVEDLQQGRRKYSPFSYLDSYAYWLLSGRLEKWLEMFWGYGGSIMLCMKGEAQAAPPPKIPKFMMEQPGMKDLLATYPLEQQMVTAAMLRHPFVAESKKMFGADLPDNLTMKGVPFIVPTFRSEDFFTRPAEDVDNLFKLVDLYIIESPADGGVLVATRLEALPVAVEIIAQMRKEKAFEA